MSKVPAPPSQEIGGGGIWLGKALLRELKGLDSQGKDWIVPKGMEGGEMRIFEDVQYNILKIIT